MTFADKCLERASKAHVIAVKKHFNLEAGCDAWLELQRLDVEMRDKLVPELARRLKRACAELRHMSNRTINKRRVQLSIEMNKLADELEMPLEGK